MLGTEINCWDGVGEMESESREPGPLFCATQWPRRRRKPCEQQAPLPLQIFWQLPKALLKHEGIPATEYQRSVKIMEVQGLLNKDCKNGKCL